MTELLKKQIAKSKLKNYKAEDTSSSTLNQDRRIREWGDVIAQEVYSAGTKMWEED